MKSRRLLALGTFSVVGQALSGFRLETRTGIPNKVAMEFVGTAQGSVRDVRVIAAGNSEPGNRVSQAIPGWRYRPATRDGQPVASIEFEVMQVSAGR